MTHLRYGPGTYVTRDPLLLTGHGPSIRGAGLGGTEIIYTGEGAAIRTVMPPGETIQLGVQLSGFTLVGGGIDLKSTYKATVDDLYVRGASGFGLHVGRSDGHAYAAYNVIRNVMVDGSGCAGNGIILGEGSEFTSLRDSTASYYRRGVVPATHYAEPDIADGAGLVVASSNNSIDGCQFDRCTMPLVVWFGDNNKISAATDNAQGSGVVLIGATKTTGTISVGRMDPHLPDGATPNPRYGSANWRGVHVCNVSAANDLGLVFLRDTAPPALPAGRASWPYGGWGRPLDQNNGTGQPQHGGENAYRVLPRGLVTSLSSGAWRIE